MIVFESRLIRRFVGRLERAEELIGTLRQLCEHERIRAGWIRGSGIFEWVDLTEWDTDREAWRAPRRVEGPITAVSLEGNVSIRNGPPWVQVHAMLCRQGGPESYETFGGTVSSARVYAIDFAVEVYEDIRLERDEDTSTGLSLFKGQSVRGTLARNTAPPVVTSSRSKAPPREASQIAIPMNEPAEPEEDGTRESEAGPVAPSAGGFGGISWAQVAAASEEAEKVQSAPKAMSRRVPEKTPQDHLPPPIPERSTKLPVRAAKAEKVVNWDEPNPSKGEYVDHRQFGLCRVDGEDDEGGLKIRLPSGVRKVIRLDFMEVLPPRFEGDRTIYPLRPRKR